MGMAIDTSRIEAMVAQLKSVSARAQGVAAPLEASPAAGINGMTGTAGAGPAVNATGEPDFGDALRAQLDQVNASQVKADQLGQRFSTGDDSVSLSDVMIASQKANIGFQATIQVRNKVVQAYQSIMAMQV